MKKTLLLLVVALLGALFSTPVSATHRYLNTDGTPNYSQFSSQANNNQLNADMRNALMQGLGAHNSQLVTALNAIKQRLDQLFQQLQNIPNYSTQLTRIETAIGAIKNYDQQMSQLESKLDSILEKMNVTPPAPTAVAGKCGASLGACESGTATVITMTEDCGKEKVWNCNGLHGGNNVSCKVSNPACPTEAPLVSLSSYVTTDPLRIYYTTTKSLHIVPSGYSSLKSYTALQKGFFHAYYQNLPSNRKGRVGNRCIYTSQLDIMGLNLYSTIFYIKYEQGTVTANGDCTNRSEKQTASITIPTVGNQGTYSITP